MARTRKEKEQLVGDLTEALRSAEVVVVFSFRTLTVAESAKLRRDLRMTGSRLQVVKKRLFKRIAGALGMSETVATAGDSLAVAWGADAVAPAKAVHAFAQAHDGSRLLGGMLHGAFLGDEAVQRLALLPGIEGLRGQLVSVLAGPLRGFAGVLSGTLRGLPGVLHALAEQRGASTSHS